MGTNSNKNLASELGLITPKGRGGFSSADSHAQTNGQSSAAKHASQDPRGTPFEGLSETRGAASSDPYSVAHSIREKSEGHSSHSASHGSDHNKALKLTDKELGMIGTPFSTLAVESAMARSEKHAASTISHSNPHSNSVAHSHDSAQSSTQSKALNLTDKEFGMIGTPFSTLAVESAMARGVSHGHSSQDVSHNASSGVHSHGDGLSKSSGLTHSVGASMSENIGISGGDSVGVSSSHSRGNSISKDSGQSFTAGSNRSVGTSYNESVGISSGSDHGESFSTSRGVNGSSNSGVSQVTDGLLVGHSYGASHSSNSGVSHGGLVTESNSKSMGMSVGLHHSELHEIGVGAVESAVKGHLHSQGVSSAESHFVSSSVSSSLSESLSKGTASSMGSHINFHKEGEAAVSVGHSIGSHEGTSVSMSTLQAVHDHGMPTKGISAIRENLGAEVSNHSDLQVVDKVGHDVTRAIGEQGFPAHEVNKMSQESGSSKLEALQAIGDHARVNAQESNQPAKVAEQQREM